MCIPLLYCSFVAVKFCVFVLDGVLLVLSFVKLVMDLEFMVMMRVCFDLCYGLRLEACLLVFYFNLSVPVFSIFVFHIVVLSVVVVVFFLVVIRIDSLVLIFVGDEALCLSSSFWFAILENSFRLLVGFVLFILEVNACHGVDYCSAF